MKPLLTCASNSAGFCFERTVGTKWSSATSHSWMGMDWMKQFAAVSVQEHERR